MLSYFTGPSKEELEKREKISTWIARAQLGSMGLALAYDGLYGGNYLRLGFVIVASAYLEKIAAYTTEKLFQDPDRAQYIRNNYSIFSQFVTGYIDPLAAKFTSSGAVDNLIERAKLPTKKF